MKKKFLILMLFLITVFAPISVRASELTIMPISTNNWGDSALLESNGKYLLMDVTRASRCDPDEYDTCSNEGNDHVFEFLNKKIDDTNLAIFDLYLSHYDDDHYGGWNSLGSYQTVEKNETTGQNETVRKRISLMEYMILNSNIPDGYVSEKNGTFDFGIGTIYLPDPSALYASAAYKTESVFETLLNAIIKRNEDGEDIEVVILTDKIPEDTDFAEGGNKEWFAKWEAKGLKRSVFKNEFTIGTTKANVLYINKVAGGDIGESLRNNSSLVTMFTSSSGIKFLSAGDIEEPVEKVLVEKAQNKEIEIKADIFKLNHHGESIHAEGCINKNNNEVVGTSNWETFLSEVAPKYAYFQMKLDQGNKLPFCVVEPAVSYLNKTGTYQNKTTTINANVYTSQVFKLWYGVNSDNASDYNGYNTSWGDYNHEWGNYSFKITNGIISPIMDYPEQNLGYKVTVKYLYPSNGSYKEFNNSKLTYYFHSKLYPKGIGKNATVGIDLTYRVKDYKKTFEGYRQKETTKEGSEETGHIEYEVFYEPLYTLTYKSDGIEISGQEYVENESVELLSDVPSKMGYTFGGWKYNEKVYNLSDEFIMPDSDITLDAVWVPNTNTPYKVKDCRMDLNEKYTLCTERNLVGTTDTKVTPEVLTYEGFTSPKAQEITIKGDGSSEVIYNYDRNKYTLSITGDKGIKDKVGEGTYYYEQEVEVSVTLNYGYELVEWNNGITKLSQTIKVSASNMELKVTTNPNTNTPYKVKDCRMDLNGKYTLCTERNLVGTTDTKVTPEVLTYEGFTSPKAQEITIKGDGSSEVIYNYDRNKYTLSITGDKGIKDKVGEGTYYYEQEVEVSVTLNYGYELVEWNNGITKLSQTIKVSASNMELKVTTNPNTNTPYKVKDCRMDLNGKYTLCTERNLVGTTDTKVTPEVLTYEGFTSPKAQEITIKGDGSSEVIYNYDRNKYTLSITGDKGIKDKVGEGTYYYEQEVEVSVTLNYGYELVEWNNGITKLSQTIKMSNKNLELFVSTKRNISNIEVDISYEIKDNLIIGIKLGTDISKLNLKLDDIYKVKTYNKNNVEKTTGNIATSDKLKIYLGDTLVSEYILSVKGDVTGTGTSTVSDVAKLYQYLKKKIDMEDCYKEAGNVVSTDNEIKINDVAKLYQFIKGKISSLED